MSDQPTLGGTDPDSSNPDRASARPASGGGNATAMTMSAHLYEVESAPEGCSDYEKGDQQYFYVPDPPPAKWTMSVSGPCNGTVWVLIS